MDKQRALGSLPPPSAHTGLWPPQPVMQGRARLGGRPARVCFLHWCQPPGLQPAQPDRTSVSAGHGTRPGLGVDSQRLSSAAREVWCRAGGGEDVITVFT